MLNSTEKLFTFGCVLNNLPCVHYILTTSTWGCVPSVHWRRWVQSVVSVHSDSSDDRDDGSD